MNIQNLVSALSGGKLDCTLVQLYGHSEIEVLKQRTRFINMAEHFSRLYPEHDEIRVFSAPACIRTGGIHTAEHKGCILSTAVTSDIIAIAGFHNDDIIRIKIDESEAFEVPLDSELDSESYEQVYSPMVRGIVEQFRKLGIETGGFDVYISSDIPDGCGISVNDTFAVLIAGIIDAYYNNNSAGALKRAEICNLYENDISMNKIVCSVGGFISADLRNPESPAIRSIGFDFSRTGYSLCITGTGDAHDLKEDYPNISGDEHEFYESISELRKKGCSDNAILKAVHFLDENERALLESDALKMGRLDDFFRLINESGDSSAFLQQNLSVTLALMVSRRKLHGSGAVRINAGTVQAFVPSYTAEYYAEEMEKVFGAGSCKIMGIRSAGCIEITGG